MKKLFKKITNSVESFAARIKTAAANFVSAVTAFNRRVRCHPSQDRCGQFHVCRACLQPPRRLRQCR